MDKIINCDASPKRVYCLYRVSTLGQVEKDDIPMQKQCCREFAETQGWTIIKEFSEKGISGFKVSAKDRDAIQHIQQDAISGKFDILLVFMFDRLGRRDDETPFVVEWFVKNGIEVWSAMEGQQRFDSILKWISTSLLMNSRVILPVIPCMGTCKHLSHAPHKKVRENPIFTGFSRLWWT